MANDADWFKIYPAKYLSIAGRIPDGTQRAEFLLIVLHCLDQGPLPNDDDEIAFITAISIDRIKLLRPYLNRLCQADSDTVIPCLAADTIAERREFSEKKAKAGREGGKQNQAKPSSAKQNQAVLSKAKQNEAQPSQTDRQTDRQAVVGDDNDDDPKPSPKNLSDAIAEAMGMKFIPEGKPGDKLRTIAEEFRLAGIKPDDVTEFVKDWYARKVNSGWPNAVLIPDYLAADCPGWVNAKRMRANGKAVQSAPSPSYKCPKCKDRFAYVENGQTVKCDCWQKEAA